jgi:hypothetical protein
MVINTIATLPGMHFKSGRNGGIGMYAPNGTTLKVMEQNKIQVRRNSLY